MPDKSLTSATQEDWEDVRLAFYNSIMMDSQLDSLAQNAELGEWRRQSKRLPANTSISTGKSFRENPGLAEHPERIELLITILKGYALIRRPFREMVSHRRD